MVSLRLGLPFAAAVLIGCGGGESPSPADQMPRQAEAADTPSATSGAPTDTAADGRAASLGPGTAKVDGSLVVNLQRDSKAAARAVVEAERIVRRCARLAKWPIADPLELSACKTDLTETGVLNAVSATSFGLSRIEPDLTWIFLGRTDTGECRRAVRSEQRIVERHSILLERIALFDYAARDVWPFLAARNTKLTERHGEALRRLRSACRL